VRHGRQKGRYDKLVLVAPPRFLGALHDSLDEATTASIVGEVRRELMTLSPAELRTHLPRRRGA
jgi:protein required for attachment to host cells